MVGVPLPATERSAKSTVLVASLSMSEVIVDAPETTEPAVRRDSFVVRLVRFVGWTSIWLGLFLLGMISKRANNPIAVSAVTLGALLICWMTVSSSIESLPSYLQNPFHKYMIPVFGTSTILITGLLLGCLIHPRPTSPTP